MIDHLTKNYDHGVINIHDKIKVKPLQIKKTYPLSKIKLPQTYLCLAAEHLIPKGGGSHQLSVAQIFLDFLKKNRASLNFIDDTPVNFMKAYKTICENITKSSSQTIYRKAASNLSKLKIGECLILNISSDLHSMSSMVKKIDENHFTYYQFNTGEGLNYHYKKIEKGIPYYQQVKIIESVKEEKLKLYIDNCHKILENQYPNPEKLKGTDLIYEEINNLEGRDVESNNITHWGTSQLGDSCSGTSQMPLFRSLMTPENFDEFETRLKVYCVFEIYKDLMIGADKDLENQRKIGCLEIIQSLRTKKLDPKATASLNKINAYVLDFIQKHTKEVSNNLPEGYFPNQLEQKNLDDQLKYICFLVASKQYDEAQSIVINLYKTKEEPDVNSTAFEEILINYIKIIKKNNEKRKIAFDINFGIVSLIKKIKLSPHFSKRNEYKDFVIKTKSRYAQALVAKTFPDSPWVNNIPRE